MKMLRPIVICLLSFSAAVFGPYSLKAQTKVSQIDQIVNAPTPKIGQMMDNTISPSAKTWLSEHTLDSLDQAKIPKIVTMGLLLNANLSNFLIYNPSYATHKLNFSYMRVGIEFGSFMDFLVMRHFAIQARVVFTAEQNQFGVGNTSNLLWSIGADIPVLFLYRLGNLEKGYFNVGAGVFAHFTFANNLGVYKNVETSPAALPAAQPEYDYVSLHDNHAGLMAHIGYEFPFGMQINAAYQVSLTDIFGYYKNTKGTVAHDVAFYPQRISLGVAYRWK